MTLESTNYVGFKRFFHHHGELYLLRQINILSFYPLPFKFPYQIPNEILQMKNCQTKSRTYSPPCSKRHHLSLFAPCYIKLNNSFLSCTAFHEPLWLKLHRIFPHFWIPTHFCHHEIHTPILRYHIILQLCIFFHSVW
uniref:Uncharacterized protein n=1 Tax=Cucumis sativus TaxID=3659 RepID=A0A0A0LQY0_CUCSA